MAELLSAQPQAMSVDDSSPAHSLELSQARRRRHRSTRKGRSDARASQQTLQHEERVASAPGQIRSDEAGSEDGSTSIRSSSAMSSSARLGVFVILLQQTHSLS